MWCHHFTLLGFPYAPNRGVQAGPKVLHDYATPPCPVCHSLSKCHPWPGWSHSKSSHCQLDPTHRKGMHLLVLQDRSSRAEGLPKLLDFKLCLEHVELRKMSSLPDQVCTALLHAANGWYERSGTTSSFIHIRLKVSVVILLSPSVYDNGHRPHFSPKMWSCIAQSVITITWHECISSLALLQVSFSFITSSQFPLFSTCSALIWLLQSVFPKFWSYHMEKKT